MTLSKKQRPAHQKIREGVIHIQSTYNNTIVSVCDDTGNVIAWSSSGRVGFSGTRKATPYAAGQAVRDVIERIKPLGMEEARLVVRGIGSARETAVRTISASGITITSIKDVTPIPHNGVRPPKRRRV